MARVLKEEEYNAKRNEILDFSLRLVYSKGYERMTVQDILDGLHISRGALYHYFDSKQALLEALVERLRQQGLQELLPVVQDPGLTAIQKFRRYFELSAQIKSTQKELIFSILSMWYSEENAIIRQKIVETALKWAAHSILEPIIRQGVQEGVFTTRYPAQVARIVMGIAMSLSDSIVELLLAPHPDQDPVRELDAILNAYFEAAERILGAPPGSLKVFVASDFEEWWSQPLPDHPPPSATGAI